MAKKEILKPFIESWEGGFVNNPYDKGGATNKGVTLATFQRVYGASRTIADLKKITDEQWLNIFDKYYWSKWKADGIVNQSIANLLVDWVWTSGVYGIKLPQKVLGVKIDGIVGAKTLAAINNAQDQKYLFSALWSEREAYFYRIGKGTQARFLKGWLNRLNGIKYGSLVCNNKKKITF